jgi:hypothetical protein
MISLRQHIFSLVAVFVALAVGIAAGSTVVRGPLLDSTRSRLESAEESIELERAENDALAAEVAQLDDWATDGPQQLLAGHLDGAAVVLVVAGDADRDVVSGVVRSLRAASATLVGEVRIASSVFDPDRPASVAAAMGAGAADGTDPAVAFGQQVGDHLIDLASQVRAGTDGSGADVLRSLFGGAEDDGLLDLTELTSQPVQADDLEVAVLTDRNLVADPAVVLDGVIATSDPATGDLHVLVAEVGRVLQGNDDPMPSYVGAIRDSGRLRDEVSTVDNAETILGWVAVVLGLQATRQGVIDHYGFREGASRAIPSPLPTDP